MIRTISLEHEAYYHIYNRGNNSEIIFREESNYFYFLKLLKKYILPVADVFAYCLLNNHFHLLIRIKEEDKITVNIEKSFSNLFNAYAKPLINDSNALVSFLKNGLKGRKLRMNLISPN